jgi:uncharacterized membrane protein YbhN (UPF0104 family)
MTAAGLKPFALLLVKMLVTGVLLVVLAQMVDLSATASTLARVRLDWVGLVFGLMLVATVFEAAQFRRVMGVFEHSIAMRTSIVWAICARFFAILSPAMIGGDIFRVTQLRRGAAPIGLAVRMVLVVRLFSLMALLPVLMAGLPVAMSYAVTLQDRLIVTVVPLAAGLGGVLLVAHHRMRLFRALAERSRILRAVGRVSNDIWRVAIEKPHARHLWSVAVTQHLLRIAMFAALAQGLGVDVPLLALFAFVPMSLLVAMVPITLGSWGLREAALVYGLGFAGVAPEAALSLSVAFGLAGLGYGALAGVFWAVMPAVTYSGTPTKPPPPL